MSDLDFTLGGPAGSYTLQSSSAQEITVALNGTFTTGATVSTGWALGTLNGGLILCVTCPSNASVSSPAVNPSHLLLGPPGPGNLYSNANGSIAGNKPHNPFLNQTATFTISSTSITSNTTVTGATFSFGTSAGVTVGGVPQVPEPGTYSMLASGLGLLALARKSVTQGLNSHP